MSVLREAVALPGLFLTVTLLGGLRIGPTIRFVPPPLMALVLGLLIIAALVRAGAFEPASFVHQARRPLENLSGVVVAFSFAAASVQVFNLLTPDRGLLHVLFGTFFFVQLLSTIAGTSDRRALLRSLTVLLGSAFVLRYIVLESVYARTGGTLARILTVLMEGVSLGALQYEPNGPATGYVAFVALSLYLIGVFLLHTSGPSRGGSLSRTARAALIGHPAERHELHGDLPPSRHQREPLERRLDVELGRDAPRLGQNLRVEIGDLPPHGVRALVRALDVTGLLHAPPDAARGRRGPAECPDADRLAPEERSKERRADRHHRLQLGLRGLILLACDRGLGAAQALDELRLFRGVLPPHGVDRLVPRRTVRILEADPEVALALAGPGRELQIAVPEHLQLLGLREPASERLLPAGVVPRLQRG